MATLLTLPPHLLERIQDLLDADVPLPHDLADRLARQIRSAQPLAETEVEGEEDGEADRSSPNKLRKLSSDHVVPDEQDPPSSLLTVEDTDLEELARFADTPAGRRKLRRAHLDPSAYSYIALLAGTQAYVPPSQLPHLKASESSASSNPYLPTYLSPAPTSLGTEYRALSRQLSTTLNVVFSIFGCAFAAYFAAVTGAGWKRESAVLLGVGAGCVVGLADGVLVWIWLARVEKVRKVRWERGRAEMMGSARVDEEGKEGVAEVSAEAQGPGHEVVPGDARMGGANPKRVDGLEGNSVAATGTETRTVRLRRRNLRDEYKVDA